MNKKLIKSKKILFVCLGNICRSPMAEYVFRRKIEAAGLSDQIEIDSSGTSGYNNGRGIHKGTAAILQSKGISYSDFVSTQVRRGDEDRYDLFIVMDDNNKRDLEAIISAKEGQIMKITDLIPESGYTEVPDPYYTGDFDETFRLIDAATDSLLQKIQTEY